jgi:hypothetical protein
MFLRPSYLPLMNSSLQFDPTTHQLVGPAGALPIGAADPLARRFLMLVEGECLEENIVRLTQKYGFSRQRYYQLLEQYKAGGLPALEPRKTGPKTQYRRTEQLTRQVLRYRFLDPEASPAVITQKLRQTHFQISLRSVQRVLADFGLQKKTLHPQPASSAAGPARAARRPTNPSPTRRRRQRGTGGATTPGR